MRLLYWNVYIGNKPSDVLRALRRLIRQHKPEIIGLGEATRVAPYLEKGIPGYTAYTFPKTHEGAADTAVLVRDGVFLRRNRWLRMTKWWTGPKHGKRQGPKRYWSGRFKVNGKIARISIGHWPFNTAVEETENRIALWFKSRLPSGHFGDLNMHGEEAQRYAQRVGGRTKGQGPDRAVYKNGMRITHTVLPRGISDHHPVIFDIEV
jgi:hypothetical protein